MRLLQSGGAMLPRPNALPRSSRGFTLVELLTVVVIVGALSGLVLGAAYHASSLSHGARAKADLAVLAAGLESFKRQFGDYPRTDSANELLQALIGRRTAIGEIVSGRAYVDLAHFKIGSDLDPFVSTAAEIIDPWEQPYAYAYRSVSPWTNPSYVLYSRGPDRTGAELLSGGRADDSALANADNVYANQ